MVRMTAFMKKPAKPVLLIIRDGWGYNPDPAQDAFNATRLASTPVDDRLQRDWPCTRIAASGLDVGVPVGVMGNSEVGHQNIGAGRIVDQEIVRITKAFAEGTIAGNETWQKVISRVRDGKGKLHFFGLVSDAGVSALVGDRVAWGERGQGSLIPAVVLWDVSSVGQYSLDGDTSLRRTRVQVDVWADTYEEADETERAVDGLLSGYRGSVGGVMFQGIFRESRRDTIKSDANDPDRLWGVRLEYTVNHQEL